MISSWWIFSKMISSLSFSNTKISYWWDFVIRFLLQQNNNNTIPMQDRDTATMRNIPKIDVVAKIFFFDVDEDVLYIDETEEGCIVGTNFVGKTTLVNWTFGSSDVTLQIFLIAVNWVGMLSAVILKVWTLVISRSQKLWSVITVVKWDFILWDNFDTSSPEKFAVRNQSKRTIKLWNRKVTKIVWRK